MKFDNKENTVETININFNFKIKNNDSSQMMELKKFQAKLIYLNENELNYG